MLVKLGADDTPADRPSKRWLGRAVADFFATSLRGPRWRLVRQAG
jgi:hypothetical protein